MYKERSLEIVRIGEKENSSRRVSYYINVSEPEENEFSCVMYNVGINDGEKNCVIENFSSEKSEAEEFLDAIYDNSMSAEYLNLFAEEYIISRM